jgi:hypothetical protein
MIERCSILASPLAWQAPACANAISYFATAGEGGHSASGATLTESVSAAPGAHVLAPRQSRGGK